MIVASGFIELQGIHSAGKVILELKKRGIAVDDFRSDRIIFLIERDSIEDVRTEIRSLKLLEDVQNVHLTYYSMENVDGQPESGRDR
jgi:nitrate reductase NapAB chaperone NapD